MLALQQEMLYDILIPKSTRIGVCPQMSHSNRKRNEWKSTAVRVISLALAALMLMSVILAAVWQW